MRDRILDAALRLFTDNGFTGTTITEVERRVGLAAGTGSLYRHFPSKQALLRAAVEREVTRLREEISGMQAALRETADPAERRLRSYELRLHGLRQFDRFFRLMLNEGSRVPELREAMWSVLQVPVPSEPRDAEVTAAIAETALGGYHLFSMMQGRPYNAVSEERFLRALTAMTKSGRHQHNDPGAESRGAGPPGLSESS
jgi:AcrR family transcriptional regulator